MSSRHKRIFAVASMLIALACACPISLPGGSPTEETPGSGASNTITLIDEDGNEVQIKQEPPDFVEHMLAQVDSGDISLEEGVISSLKILTGEVKASEVYGEQELVFEAGWGLSNLAIEAYADASDDDKAEIERLYNILHPPQENLDLYAAPDTESWRPPQLAALSLPALGTIDCRAIAGRGFPAESPEPPICLLYQSFAAGGNEYRVYFPRDRRGDGSMMAYVEAAVAALRESQAVLEPFSDVGDINLVFTSLPGPSGVVAGVPGLVDSPGAASRACPVSVFPAYASYNTDDFKQIVAHEIFHCVSYWRKGTTGWRASFWYQEGMAEHFSNVVYPDNNLEIRTRLSSFDSRSADTWLMDMTYSNFIFFQYLENRFGNEFLISLLDALPPNGDANFQAAELASSVGGIQEIFHDFGKAYINREILDSGGTTIPNQVYYLPDNDHEIGEGASLFMFGEVFTISRYRLQFDDGIEYEIFKDISGSPGEVSWKQEEARAYTEIPDELRTHCEEPENYIVLMTTAPPGASSSDTVDMDFDANIAENGRMDCCLVGTWEQQTNDIRSNLETILSGGATLTELSGTFLMSIDEERFMAFGPSNYQGTVVFPDEEVVTVRVDGASTGTFVLPDDEPLTIRKVEESSAFVITLTGASATTSYPLAFGSPLAGSDSFAYTCTATTLTAFTGGLAPFTESVFTRISEVPMTPQPPEDLPTSPGGGDDPSGFLPAEACAQIIIDDFSTGVGTVSWTMTNGSSEVFEIDSIYMDWAEENGALEGVGLDGTALWSGSQGPVPSLGLIDSDWTADRSVVPGALQSLSFTFANDSVAASGYIVVLEFTNGCFANGFGS